MGILAGLAFLNSTKLLSLTGILEQISKQTKRKDLPAFVIKNDESRPMFFEFVSLANKVIICDAFFSTFDIKASNIVELLERNCDVVIIVLHPQKRGILGQMAALSYHEDVKGQKKQLERGISFISKTAKDFKTRSSEKFGDIDLFFSEKLLPLSAIMIENDNGKTILVELYPFGYGSKIQRHHFILDNEHTQNLFGSYENMLVEIQAQTNLHISSKS